MPPPGSAPGQDGPVAVTALLASEHPDLFRATLDAVPDAVVIVDGQGVIVTANTQVEGVFGYRPAELEQQLIEVLVPTRLRTGHPRRRSSYTRRPMGLLQLAAVRRDGTEFPAEISLAPIELGDGTTWTAATVRDISERIRLEAESERLRDEMLATVTHELRTPLTVIIGYVDMLLELDETLRPEARRTMLGKVARSAHRELTLVNDLLTLATGTLHAVPLELEDVDLDALVRTTVAERRTEAASRAVTLVARLSDADAERGTAGAAARAPVARADPQRLRQVLDNLLGNALKFTPAGGRVVLGVEVLGDSVVLTVADTGPGIPVEERERIFERLYRVPTAIADAVPGTGLGLAIVKAIVEAHRGTVAVTSEMGTGSTFTVQLPGAR
ncbi:PAS domain S-box protein [Nocardioides sp. ChNu-153]|uniref:sensor histidine kinase n=1 Tax=unclassified Nocardioides TaxID=2615069 RepID=UPI0024066888|nr:MULTISPECIES: ATP-binding protein [unclassified Nocardioides]MDF9715190.1 PAS domain-containing sensor histidine kinase [Nocardioides sp. ChNu-99]MDN7121031.1 PAS domain S-box protein [Nocardioides sp. ChNu-153]